MKAEDYLFCSSPETIHLLYSFQYKFSFTWNRLRNISARRKKHKLIMFYRLKNNMCPTYLSSLVPPTVGNISRYDFRNVDNIQTIRAHSQLYFDSLLPSVVRDWNALLGEIRNSTSLFSFKNQLNLNIRSPLAFYCSGSRQGQIYHVRLRTNCRSLKLHLYSKI